MQVASRFVSLPALARLTGRSWWALRYSDGRFVDEPSCDWGQAPYGGRQSLRLYCPNGEVAELGNDGGDATGRLFQLKQAVVGVGVPKRQLCHLIGLVVGRDGRCVCAAWEYEHRRLVRFEDNALAMRYGTIGRLGAENLGLSFG